MEKIRVGKTITLKWAILTNGVAQALADRDLALMLHHPSQERVQLEFTIEGINKIVATIEGKSLTRVGTYTLVLWENKGKANQTVIDTDCFMLVARTIQEAQTQQGDNLQSQSLDLGDAELRVVTENLRLTTAQVNAINSGVTAAKVAGYDRLSGYIDDLKDAINDLPDGQAVSGQTVVNTADIADLKPRMTQVENAIDAEEARAKAVEERLDILANGSADADLDIADADGNVLTRYSGGHVKTKNFDSADICERVGTLETDLEEETQRATSNESTIVDNFTSALNEEITRAKAEEARVDILADGATESELDIADESGNVIARFSGGHIKTKNFDSEEGSEHPISVTDFCEGDYAIADESGNAIAKFSGGEFRTQKFDSTKTPIQTDAPDAEFQITDDDGNCVVKFESGHIKTKHFDSRNPIGATIVTLADGRKMLKF